MSVTLRNKLTNIFAWWPLLVAIALLTWIVWGIEAGKLAGLAQHPNLQLIPYKLDIMAIAMFIAHVADVLFEIDDDRSRSIVYGATVIAFALTL